MENSSLIHTPLSSLNNDVLVTKSDHFPDLIIDDLKELIEKKGLNELASKQQVSALIKKFQARLSRSTELIGKLINNPSLYEDDKNRIFATKHQSIKVWLKVHKYGGYTIHVGFRKEHEVTFNNTYLTREFKREAGYVYFIYSNLGWKIGKSRDITKRRKTFEVKLPFEFAIKHYIQTISYSQLEKDLHKLFKARRINGEWFDLSDQDFKDLRVYLENTGYKLFDCDLRN